MKKIAVLLFLAAGSFKAHAQSYELQQLILDVEKLAQMKQILTDMYDGYKVVEGGYTAIRDISQGNFNLHQAFLQGLLAVSPAVKNYYKVAEIISMQLRIVSEYKQALGLFRSDGHFTPDEVTYIGNVYTNLFNQSTQDLGTLATILTGGQIRASDDERLRQIDGLHKAMQDRLGFLLAFDNRTALLSLQRGKDQSDIDQIKKMYGLQ